KWHFWRRRPSSEEERAILLGAPSSSPCAEDYYFAVQIRARLNEALDRLSPRQRTVFALRHFDGMALEEISTILKLDVGTVKAHMHRAIWKLRGELGDLYGGRSGEKQ